MQTVYVFFCFQLSLPLTSTTDGQTTDEIVGKIQDLLASLHPFTPPLSCCVLVQVKHVKAYDIISSRRYGLKMFGRIAIEC